MTPKSTRNLIMHSYRSDKQRTLIFLFFMVFFYINRHSVPSGSNTPSRSYLQMLHYGGHFGSFSFSRRKTISLFDLLFFRFVVLPDLDIHQLVLYEFFFGGNNQMSAFPGQCFRPMFDFAFDLPIRRRYPSHVFRCFDRGDFIRYLRGIDHQRFQQPFRQE